MKSLIVLILFPFVLYADDFAYLDCYVANVKAGEKSRKIFEFDWDKKYDVVDFRFYNKKGENVSEESNVKLDLNGWPKFTVSNKYFNWESSIDISPDLNFESISISIDRTSLHHKSYIYPKVRSYSEYEISYDISGKCELTTSRKLTQKF